MPDQNIVVVHVVQHLSPGGIETMAMDLMAHSSPSRDVHIVSLEGKKFTAVEAWPRLRPAADRLTFLNKRPGFDFALLSRLAKTLNHLKTDVVHTHHIGPLIYAGLAARLINVPCRLHTEHDAWHLSNCRRRWVQRAALTVVRPTLVADANTVADAVRAAIPSSTPVVIHNGIDTQRFRPGEMDDARLRLGLPADVTLIGCAARLVAVKRHVDLIDSLLHLDPSVHLVLAGDGPERNALQSRIDGLGLEARVHFLGTVDAMEIFYQAIDVFCLASEFEGLPLSPLEAQASGVPCVLTDVGGTSEALCPSTGTLVAPHDPAALATALSAAAQRTDKDSPRTFVSSFRNLNDTVRAYEALHHA